MLEGKTCSLRRAFTTQGKTDCKYLLYSSCMGWYEELNKILSAAGRQVQGQHIPKPKDIRFTNHFQAIAMLRKPPHRRLHHLHLVVISKCPGYMLPIDHTIGILIKPEASVDIAEFLC
jgi:hypothetical protein